MGIWSYILKVASVFEAPSLKHPPTLTDEVRNVPKPGDWPSAPLQDRRVQDTYTVVLASSSEPRIVGHNPRPTYSPHQPPPPPLAPMTLRQRMEREDRIVRARLSDTQATPSEADNFYVNIVPDLLRTLDITSPSSVGSASTETPKLVSGEGGDFGGAGASGSWSEPDPSDPSSSSSKDDEL